MQIKEQDFSHIKNFPGEHGNFFDVALHRSADIEKIPGPLFALMLFGLAVLTAWSDWPRVAVLWLFFMTDWLLLALLPPLRLSFGPPKPPAFVLALLRLIVALLPFPSPLALGFQFLGSLLIVYGFWIEPHWLHITRQRLSLPGFKASRPLRLLHFSDLHMEYLTEREKGLVEACQTLQPDLILFSGDFLNQSNLHDLQSWSDVAVLFSQLQAPLGVYVVSGSPAIDLPEVLPGMLKGLPIHWLEDQRVSLTFEETPINLIGLHCTHRPHLDKLKLQNLLANIPASPLNILLYHSPDLAPAANSLDVQLQLSGHTHGGQVCLPFFGPFFTASLYGRVFASGRYHLGHLTLYITRGLGLEGMGSPRVRFLCRPELVLWEIGPES